MRTANEETFRRLKEVRAEAVEHYQLAQQAHSERRDIIRTLMKNGVSKGKIARELGVSRRDVRKMLS